MVLALEGTRLVMYNFLTNAVVDYTPVRAAVMQGLPAWASRRRARTIAGRHVTRPDAVIEALLRDGFLIEAGTDAARQDEEFVASWDWDIRAGVFHLSIKDPVFLSDAEQTAELTLKAAVLPPVSLATTNASFQPVTAVPRPRRSDPVMGTMLRRRTRRAFARRAMPLQTLADTVFAGLGITGYVEDAVKGLGRLPLKMTPSGGARNPYEAFVHVSRVTGLEPGWYHYSAGESTFGWVAPCADGGIGAHLAGQTWADAAAAVVLLVANYRRTMWKYGHPMVYRAVLIEAGHIAQNMMLMAASRGLASVPTAALHDTYFEATLGLSRITQGAVYAIGLGHAASRRPDYGVEHFVRLPR